jgi:hypothetical protein
MKKIITKAVFSSILAFGANPLYAGPGHDHDHGHSHSHTKVNEAQAKKIAEQQLNHYVLDGKLDKSWKDVPVKSVKQQTYQGSLEWAFTFNNPNEPKQEQHNLYIFINQYGEMTGANFSGE